MVSLAGARRASQYAWMLRAAGAIRCRPECGWNSGWRILREHEGIVSGDEVNRLIDGFCGEGLPTINLAHVDLSRGQQRPEQHRSGVGRRQNGLRFDPSLEFFVQTFDRVGGA